MEPPHCWGLLASQSRVPPASQGGWGATEPQAWAHPIPKFLGAQPEARAAELHSELCPRRVIVDGSLSDAARWSGSWVLAPCSRSAEWLVPSGWPAGR